MDQELVGNMINNAATTKMIATIDTTTEDMIRETTTSKIAEEAKEAVEVIEAEEIEVTTEVVEVIEEAEEIEATTEVEEVEEAVTADTTKADSTNEAGTEMTVISHNSSKHKLSNLKAIVAVVAE